MWNRYYKLFLIGYTALAVILCVWLVLVEKKEPTLGQYTDSSLVSSGVDGLVDWLTFDGAKLSTSVATDEMGFKNFTPTAVVGGVGKIGQAGSFNGTGSGLSASVTGLETVSTSMSVSIWVYPKTSHTGAYFGWNDGTDCMLAQQNITTNKLSLFFGHSCGGGLTSAGTIKIGKWNFVVFTRVYNAVSSTYTESIYINGVFDNSSNYNAKVVTPANWLIGRYGSTRYFNGLMDDYKIWNKALSAAEISKLYNKGFNNLGVNWSKTARSATTNTIAQSFAFSQVIPGLIHYWTFDGQYSDTTGNGRYLDSIGTAHLARQSALTGKQIPAIIGQGINFNGTNSALATASTLDLSGVTGKVITLTYWVKINTNLTASLLLFEHTSNFNSYDGAWNAVISDEEKASGSIQDGVAGTKYRGERSNTAMTIGQWYHVAVVIDNSTLTGDIKIYYNGNQNATTITTDTKDKSSNLLNNTFYIGGRAATSYLGAASLDDVRIYNRELTQKEIYKLYKMGK